MAKKEEKYNYMENVLKDINTRYISLSNIEKQRNNVILNTVLKEVIKKMREKDNLFDELFRKEYHGGGYYCGLKVTEPNEYDLDLLLDLPALTRPEVSPSRIPGFVQIHLKNVREYEIQRYAIRGFAYKLLDDCHYLSVDKVQQWMESIINEALNEFPSAPEKSPVTKKIDTKQCGTFYFTMKKGGPAFTLEGVVDAERVHISVDLVPSFVFTDKQWPGRPYRQNPVQEKNEFFVVPKKADSSNTGDLSRCWRMSFQDQENFLIKDLQNLKPALRFLKRLRDVWDHKCIASYYIKTIFLWERDERDKSFWSKPLSYVFMEMLKKYKQFIEKGRIPYYWNKENNLIQKLSRDTLSNFANRIQRMIDDIEKHPEDPYRVVRYMEPKSTGGP